MNNDLQMPRYMKIAVDMASRIYNGEFQKEKKLRGRSTLASEYNVSPETIRRAMRLLEDMEIVTVNQGSGIHIKSTEKAYLFMERFNNKVSLTTLKKDLKHLLEEKRTIELHIKENLNAIMDYASRMKHTDVITPIEIPIPAGSPMIGKSISSVKFWENTGATVVGFRRNDEIIVSPGPYAEFKEGDTIIVVGDSNVVGRVEHFLRQ